MSASTHRLLGLAAWLGFWVFIYVSASSTTRGTHLLASMLAWSLVGLAFGVSWFAARSWMERRMPLESTHALRRFKLAQTGLWMGTVIAFLWVTAAMGVADEPASMGVVTLFVAPIWFGVRSLLEPGSAQPAS